MIALYSLIFATLINFAYVYVVYASWFKNLSLFHIATYCVLLGIGMSIPWAFIVKYTATKESLFLYSISWDVMVTIISLIVPICFYGVRFSFANWIGIGFIVAGIFTLKLTNV